MSRRCSPSSDKTPISLKTLFAGFSYIRSRQVLFGVISLDLFAVLLGGVTALLPIYARDILQTGPWGLGLLRSAPAVGALIVSIVLSRFMIMHHAGRWLFASVAAYGLAIAVFGISTSLPLSLVALAAYGAADAVSVVIRHSLVLSRTPNEMLGRVVSVNTMFAGSSGTLGEFRAGVMAAWLGAVPAVRDRRHRRRSRSRCCGCGCFPNCRASTSSRTMRERPAAALSSAPPAPSIARSAPRGRRWSRGNRCGCRAGAAGASSSR